MRYETAIGQQAQIDWKENMEFILSDGEIIIINIFVIILSYSRFESIGYHLVKHKKFYFHSK